MSLHTQYFLLDAAAETSSASPHRRRPPRPQAGEASRRAAVRPRPPRLRRPGSPAAARPPRRARSPAARTPCSRRRSTSRTCCRCAAPPCSRRAARPTCRTDDPGWDVDWSCRFRRQGRCTSDLSRASGFRLCSMLDPGRCARHRRGHRASDVDRAGAGEQNAGTVFERQAEAGPEPCRLISAPVARQRSEVGRSGDGS